MRQCGPDVSEWFVRELDAYARFHEDYSSLFNRVSATMPQPGIVSVLLFFRVLVVQIKHANIEFQSERCPGCSLRTKNRGKTLCGGCIDPSDLSNICYGYLGNLFGFPWSFLRFVAKTVVGAFDKPEDEAAAELGFKLATRGQTLGTAEDLCAFLQDNRELWRVMQRGGEGCDPCTDASAPADGPHTDFPPLTVADILFPRRFKIRMPSVVRVEE